MEKRPRILFTSTFPAPFIAADFESLSKVFSVVWIRSHGVGALWEYVRAIASCDVTFSWFASVHSAFVVLLAKIFRKKSIVVLGGADVANEKDYDYGIWNSPWKSVIVRYGIRHADVVLPVAEALTLEAIRLAEYDGKNIETLPTGYDVERWKPAGPKEQFVLMVGATPDLVRMKKKGIDILLQVAKMLPEVPFVVIGIAPEVQRQLEIPSNVQCLPFVPQDELMRYFQRAKVFLQPSRHEGMPNTLCEAMLCGCVPVGANVYGIPAAIGSAGFLVDGDDVARYAGALIQALAASASAGQAARERIVELFPKKKREERLRNLIVSLNKKR
jgi:glycosyltransferase involved in cell wall biosynthesis